MSWPGRQSVAPVISAELGDELLALAGAATVALARSMRISVDEAVLAVDRTLDAWTRSGGVDVQTDIEGAKQMSRAELHAWLNDRLGREVTAVIILDRDGDRDEVHVMHASGTLRHWPLNSLDDLGGVYRIGDAAISLSHIGDVWIGERFDQLLIELMPAVTLRIDEHVSFGVEPHELPL